jgi:hypothetical protein
MRGKEEAIDQPSEAQRRLVQALRDPAWAGQIVPRIGKLRSVAMASKYGKTASEKVEKVMKELKAGTLKSGGSGKKVTSRQQAVAIGLSEARRAGGKVPPPKKAASKKSAK